MARNNDDNSNDDSNTSTRPARGDRTRRAVLGTAVGAVPLAVSMLAGSVGGTHARTSHVPAAPMTADSPDLQFHPACQMPFKSNPVPDIDGQCSIEGAGNTDAKIAESEAKNDFCVPTSHVTPIQYDTFKTLQDNTTFRSSKDRSPLAHIATDENGASLGEGTYVKYAGVLLHAQYSNKSKGEAVNCNIPGEDTNDIHIQMVQTFGDDDACDSVTAQMSPHFRPESWTPDKLNSLQDHMIRLSGPLFYDGSHTPCRDGKRPNPQRISVWEIHPVYAVDVCRQAINVNKGEIPTCNDWVPLEEWNGTEGDEQEPQ